MHAIVFSTSFQCTVNPGSLSTDPPFSCFDLDVTVARFTEAGPVNLDVSRGR